MAKVKILICLFSLFKVCYFFSSETVIVLTQSLPDKYVFHLLVCILSSQYLSHSLIICLSIFLCIVVKLTSLLLGSLVLPSKKAQTLHLSPTATFPLHRFSKKMHSEILSASLEGTRERSS